MSGMGNYWRPALPFRQQPIMAAAVPVTSPALGQTAEDIVKLLQDLPGSVADEFRRRLGECQAQISAGGLQAFAGFRCLRDLYDEIRDYFRREEVQPLPVPISLETTTGAEEGFPIVPVLIVGGVAAAALAVAFATGAI